MNLKFMAILFASSLTVFSAFFGPCFAATNSANAISGAAFGIAAGLSPTAACKALMSKDFLNIPDATTSLISANIMPADNGMPEHCKVVGVVSPTVGFEMGMPTTGWNGNLMMQGCGGTCGLTSISGCEDMLARNFSVVMTDMGHKGKPLVGGAWAEHNLQAVIDFAYRATHVTLVAAKVIEEAFYGRPAKYKYFRGCSTGGRQAMVEAQRFPDDFDGIISIAPPMNEVGISALHLTWAARAATEKSGKKIIDADDVKRVRAAVMSACDKLDGVADGILQNPNSCKWTVAELACKAGVTAAPDGRPCLSAAKVEAFHKIYDGARNSAGRRIFEGGLPLGSELSWLDYFVSVDDTPAKVLVPSWLLGEFFRYLMFYDSPGPDYGVFDVDFDHITERLGLREQLYTGQNPDLRAFKARGGKLLLMNGWNDPLIPVAHVTDYYEAVTRLMGGAQNTKDFFRLFLVPGMLHCVGGDTADAIDSMTVLQNWVERGVAPDVIQSYRTNPQQTMLRYIRQPLTAGQIEWSRPIYPYPDSAVWSGKGDWKISSTWTVLPGKFQGQ